jgi:hypothetical protein
MIFKPFLFSWGIISLPVFFDILRNVNGVIAAGIEALFCLFGIRPITVLFPVFTISNN